MYVAITGSGKHRVIQFREDKRIPGTTKKKTHVIRTIGNYERMLAADPNIIEKLKEEARQLTLKKKESMAPLTLDVSTEEIQEQSMVVPSYHFGHALILKLWERLKLETLFTEKIGKRDQKQVLAMIFHLLLHRLSDPASIHSKALEQSQYAGLSEMKPDRFCDVLSILAESKADLIAHLAKFFETNTDRTSNRAYFDVTTFSFESTRSSELRMSGSSKKHKNNEVQVVTGLLIDNNGIPVTYELFPGSTMNQNTLISAVERLKERYGMEKITVVADRGLNGGPNLQFLCSEGHDFVISYTLKRSSKEFKKLVWDDAGWKEEISPQTGVVLAREKVVIQELKFNVPLTEEEISNVKKTRGRQKKYKEQTVTVKIHLTWSARRAAKDFADRARMLERLKQKLDKPYQLKASVKRGINQFLEMELDADQWKLSEKKVAEAQRYDGYYAIITNDLDLSTEEVTTIYHRLWKIEESFLVMKTDLESTPAYPHTDAHIKGHFALCFLALSVLYYAQYLFVRMGEEAVSAETLMEDFQDPLVLVQGDFPNIVVTPTRVTQTYLDFSRFLEMKPLKKNMTLTQFRSSTGLDLMKNLE